MEKLFLLQKYNKTCISYGCTKDIGPSGTANDKFSAQNVALDFKKVPDPGT